MSWIDALERQLLDDTGGLTPLTGELQPHQRPPDGNDWTGWLIMAGRRAGKTYGCMRYLVDFVRRQPDARMRIIAPTFADAVEACVGGPSGLLAIDPAATWHPSAPGGAVVRWPTGAEALTIGTPTPNDVDRLRATGGRHLDHFEEAAANRQLTAAFHQAELGRSMAGPGGAPPRWIAATTPRPLPLLKKWVADPSVVVRRAVTHDNKHLPQSYLTAIEERYAGTRLYRQEVLGEILEDVEGALWSQVDLDRSRVEAAPDLVKVVVGVDPPSGPGTCGIVVVGADATGHLYVLADYSQTDVTPNVWAGAVVQASRDYVDALVVAEVNQGGRMVTETLRNAAPGLPITTVHAAKGKRTRAEPIALLWEAELQSAHLVGDRLAAVEGELTGWVPGTYSPDRLDALVWAATYLRKSSGVATLHRPQASPTGAGRNVSSLAAMRRGAS